MSWVALIYHKKTHTGCEYRRVTEDSINKLLDKLKLKARKNEPMRIVIYKTEYRP